MWFGRSRRRICRVRMTGLLLRPIRRPICWATSTASMAGPAVPSRRGIIAAPMALSPIEAGEDLKQMTARTPLDRKRALRVAVTLAGLAATLGGCTHTGDVATTASIPDDYHMRHPIAVEEANPAIVLLARRGRGGLSASQRADVPVNTPNARAA